MDINYYKKYEPIDGKWYITKEIGSGAFGKVFEVERRDFTNDKSALKIITIPSSPDEVSSYREDNYHLDENSISSYFYSFVKGFINECKLMTELKGRNNIVYIEDCDVKEHENDLGWDIFIRMELLTPMNKYFRDNPPKTEDVIKLGIDICKALEVCQEFNIIHRDIKPSNIFLSDTGEYKLGDFGVARTLENTVSVLSKTGTFPYMAPEVYKGCAYGANVDTYSLGIVMYKLLNNNVGPYHEGGTNADSEKALLARMSGEPMPKPANAEERLAKIILKACSYNSEDRYENPSQMRMELERVLSNQNSEPIDDDPTFGYFRNSSKSNDSTESQNKTPKSLFWKGAIVVFAALIFVGLFLGIGLFFRTKTTNNITDITGIPESLSIASGDSMQLKAKVSPDMSEANFVYTSSNESVVSVDGAGIITANAVGEAIITVCVADYSEQVNVFVTSEVIPVEDVIVQENISMPINSTIIINSKIVPENATYSQVTYSCSNNEIVTVDENGTATAMSLGEAEIFVKAGDVEKAITVNVEKIPVTDIEGIESEIELEVGQSHKLDFVVVPDDATYKTVAFESYDDSIVSVDDAGNITAISEGTTKIKVVCDEVEKTIFVKIVEMVDTNLVNSDIVEEEQKVTIVFDMNDGNQNGNPITKEYVKGETYGDLPKPTRDGYVFYGWFDSSLNGKRINESDKTTNDATLYAYWQKTTFEVKLDANDGALPAKSHAIFDVESGAEYGSLPTPEREYYTFLGWFTSKNGGTEITSGSVCTSNVTLYARWKKNEESGWVSSLPSYVKNNREDYKIEEATWYSYSERETTTRTDTDYIRGWELYDTDAHEGQWSEFQSGYVSEISSDELYREVKIKTTDPVYKTQYKYGRWKGKNKSGGTQFHFCKKVAVDNHGNESTWKIEETDWLDTPKEQIGEWFGRCGSNHSTHGLVQDEDAYTKVDGIWRSRKYEGDWYWEYTRQIEVQSGTTLYSYKDTTFTYYFEKWSDYTEYSPQKVTETGNRDVREKTYYNYVLK